MRGKFCLARARGVMKQPPIAKSQNASSRALKLATPTGAAFACFLGAASQIAMAQHANRRGEADVPAFAPGMIDHMQAMRRFKDPDRGAQATPSVIPKFDTNRDPSGAIATFQPGGATYTSNNAFF